MGGWGRGAAPPRSSASTTLGQPQAAGSSNSDHACVPRRARRPPAAARRRVPPLPPSHSRLQPVRRAVPLPEAQAQMFAGGGVGELGLHGGGAGRGVGACGERGTTHTQSRPRPSRPTPHTPPLMSLRLATAARSLATALARARGVDAARAGAARAYSMTGKFGDKERAEEVRAGGGLAERVAGGRRGARSHPCPQTPLSPPQLLHFKKEDERLLRKLLSKIKAQADAVGRERREGGRRAAAAALGPPSQAPAPPSLRSTCTRPRARTRATCRRSRWGGERERERVAARARVPRGRPPL